MRPTQANFKMTVKTALLHQGKTVAQLAREIRRPRTTVSQAINQNRFPRVQRRIREHLRIKG